jgi:alpha-beta hydrolase superfamily lysophospholipase
MKQFFHGARLIDAHSTALTLKQRVIKPDQMLVGVGYSLGAIVLNNYVASYGKGTALDAAVSISGSLNCHYQSIFQRSRRTWQPMIAAFMKDELLLPKWGRRIQKRLGPGGFRAFLRAYNVVVRMLMVPKVHSPCSHCF